MAKLWTEFDVSFRSWLKTKTNLDSLACLIKYLGLSHVNVTENPRIFDLVDKSKVFGFICVAKDDIELNKGKEESNCFLPINVENADLTIGLLNLLIGRFGISGLGPVLEEYSSDFDIHSYINYFRPQIITPVAFAHNFTARRQRLEEDETVYFISVNSNTCKLVNRDGSQTKLMKNMTKIYNDLQKESTVFVLFEDVLKDKSEAVDKEKKLMEELTESPANQSFYDPNLSVEDLSEMENLARELEMAEQFELTFSDGQKDTSHVETESGKKIKECEERILMLQKAIAEIKSMVPITYTEVYGTKELYTNKDYLQFLQFYKKTVVVKTPQALRHSKVGKSPMSLIRKRQRHQSGSSSIFSDVSNLSTSTSRSAKASVLPETPVSSRRTKKRLEEREVTPKRKRARTDDGEEKSAPEGVRRSSRVKKT
ncbi:unnamed protein product [Bursaphelenchus okinawaensis]|uniref:Uncharacterized protein n=1 Tax=Bursaphelenchus okinawaensis TaxID=465554 RepID=A0A811JS36_9BILA|nr:unnamed protein product [Bursaphelenchus okinawaensis]CAG9080666.1 unnamed protein product [Bursaphelenchus okinawaensis]